MNNFIKDKFGLTDSGVKAVKIASVASFFVNVSYMLFMMAAMYFGDNVLKGVEKPLWFYAALTAATFIFSYVVVDIDYVKTFNATYKEAEELRLEIADRLKELPLSYFSRHDLSDLAQTIMQDVSDIEHAMSHAMPRCIGYIFFFLAMSVLMLISSPLLALATIMPLLIGFLMVYVSKGLQRKWTTKYFKRTRATTEVFQETFELQREIKNCGIEEENYKAASEALDSSERLRLKSEITQAGPLLISISFMKVTIGVVTLVSAALLKANIIELIYVVGFLLASIKLVDAVGALEETFAELFYIDARVKRLNELRAFETQAGEQVELKSFDIELSDVGFGYNDELRVINGASFTAKQNEVTAIVGPSGCGKSTVLRLISRLFDYEEGKIKIDNLDIKEIATESLFDKVSFVFQDVILFNASVLDNIRMGRNDADDEEVKEAARMANCEDFILNLPEGYDTLIGENGSKLSGGERQRISIARAFLKNAPILLLDEISSSLDVENEIKIQQALNQLTVGKTVIIVSHRLKSIEKVHKIVVMNEGSVDAVGTHEELLEKSKLYKNLIEKSKMTESFTY